ncbi:hypothetical protein [Vibrio hangzhouensis]|uniref:Lipoprotein n=1 Tax=Vibrio hangzhouensis TaxID=462991 RepID=A0A1H5W1M7_9VIBR|nr:hypothetical protein [Vibrio hangzhouensis]SEF93303.1 hypothetical protein SAMN04488244_10598 [Vibrio hangzhouensis]
MKKIYLLILCLTLTACVSVPISTIAKMSTFGWEDFQSINPEEVRVKITIPDGFVLDSEKSWFGVDINSSAGAHYGEFNLSEFELPYSEVKSRFLTKEKVTIYSLRFDKTSQAEFNDLKAFLSNHRADDIAIRVVPKLQSYPVTAEDVEVSIDIQLSATDGYFTLIDEAELSLDKLLQQKES